MSLNEQQLAKLNKVQLDESWKYGLSEFLLSPKMDELKAFLVEEKKADKIIYPPNHLIFNALNTTPLDRVKVVILGQDPYHGEGQANGLCFSVHEGIPYPPSLRNIFQELKDDVQTQLPSGDLSKWAKQGVFLLNATLTVRASQAGSHQNRGWETFTDAVIQKISQEKQHVVFILWGSYAQKKAALIDASKHHIIKAVHPSPLSSYRGFFGSKPFSKTNAYLIEKGLEPVAW